MEFLWKLIAKVVSHPRVVNWLIKRAMKTPYVHITSADGSDVYMYRYWLFNPYPMHSSGQKNWFPISIRLHRIMREDRDPHLHDHPWNARTIILDGFYWEKREGDDRPIRRSTGDTASIKFGEYHKITRVAEDGVWTMFITGKYRGSWGFKVNGEKVNWRTYLGVEKPN